MRTWILSIMTAAALMACAGCPAEEGWREGINTGIEEAVSAAISTPINAFIDNLIN